MTEITGYAATSGVTGPGGVVRLGGVGGDVCRGGVAGLGGDTCCGDAGLGGLADCCSLDEICALTCIPTTLSSQLQLIAVGPAAQQSVLLRKCSQALYYM